MFVGHCVTILKKISRVHRQNILAHEVKKFCGMPMSQDIVWIDLEMSGLDVFKDHILEVACVITDEELNLKSSKFSRVIYQTDKVLEQMNDWCKSSHERSGLTDQVRASPYSLKEVEEQLLEFLKFHKIPEKSCPLGGNSVYMDRLFIRRYMPVVDDYLHYRIIDVSTIGELARRWYPVINGNAPQKNRNHRAIDDILESIEQLKYYKKNLFRQ